MYFGTAQDSLVFLFMTLATMKRKGKGLKQAFNQSHLQKAFGTTVTVTENSDRMNEIS